jgi:hypothetical protein
MDEKSLDTHKADVQVTSRDIFGLFSFPVLAKDNARFGRREQVDKKNEIRSQEPLGVVCCEKKKFGPRGVA